MTDLAGIVARDAEWQRVSVLGVALPAPEADRRALLALLRETRKPVQTYIDWRDKRRAQWEAVANCGHPAGSDCPEFRIVQAESFDIDERLDDAIRSALSALAALDEPTP
jgi:hypothetical protein